MTYFKKNKNHDRSFSSPSCLFVLFASSPFSLLFSNVRLSHACNAGIEVFPRGGIFDCILIFNLFFTIFLGFPCSLSPTRPFLFLAVPEEVSPTPVGMLFFLVLES